MRRVENISLLTLGERFLDKREEMEIAVKTLFLGLNPKIISHKKTVDVFIPNPSPRRASFSIKIRDNVQNFCTRASYQSFATVYALSPGLEDVEVSTPLFEDFSVATTTNVREIKMRVDVSSAKTQAIFDSVFSKMVAAAQPIPGFRRMKGGKTPDIPRDVLIEVLGPSKVYKQVIKKIINSTVAEYVEKEGLKVTKDLRVEQSFEELEEKFDPGEEFSFDAVIQLHETSTRES
ncbi:hypothetical protein HHK36_013286 [Tetracentron sinense]|uniref:peptidylprolyl isomerase n=1 Tax=Tetracentron sinense TaxID=13715 RepID=A0A835DIZ9_TETSI|nr:hypothetical protein HHK36_013286 [Tetracentron sinense]